ncbi:tetratricopeptide repeat protein [Providencia sp. Me31A]|uniref:tetratricopeptide repeat protein n=1 Tax=Providencia sp. Me31A TaxID=3392637 RepID=UPI003D270E49
MTKQLKVWLCILIVIALAVSIYFINASSQSNSAQAGYDLYQQGDTEAAFKQFQKTADTDSQSAYALAMMYKGGIGTPADESQAQSWLVKSAAQNNKNALYNLGFYRYNQEMQDTQDDKNGLTSLIKAADLGLLEAQVMVGGIYMEDKYEEKSRNVEQARKYFTLAAEQDSRLAKFALGYIAHDFDKDNKKAVEILTPLVSKDFPLPAILLASIYEEGGNGITQNKFFAKRYERISMASTLEFIADADQFEPSPLSLYGSLTLEEKQKIIANLETRASNGDETAMYILYQKYMTGEDVRKNKNKAAAYLYPLVQKRAPKALYLNYLADKDNIKDLTEAADAQYLDAMYAAYRVYSGKTFNYDVKRDDARADKYLTSAADMGHEQALITIIEKTISSHRFPNKQLADIVTKYTSILMEKYPNSPDALIAASNVYGNEDSPLYSPEKSFEALEKANKISPDYDSQIQLARYYIQGFGTKQNLPEAVKILKKGLDQRGYPSTADRLLVQLYYRYDIKEYVDEKIIIDILKQDVIERKNYELAHFYADYLLQQDAEKNRKLAFELYEQSSKQNYSGSVYYAAALLKYKPEETRRAVNLIVDVLNSPNNKSELSEKEINTANNILLKVGLTTVPAKNLLVNLALFENNTEALKLIEQQIGVDADITYLYGIKKLSQLTHVDDMSDAELKPYYDTILNAAELGSQSASLYIAQNLDRVNYYNDRPYYKARFQRITGLTPDDLVAQYKKCAAQNSNRCLYELGEIYQEGKYGEDANYDTALEYYGKISDPDFSFLKSRKRAIENAKAKFIKIQAEAKQNNPAALRQLADAYKNGSYGQKVDEKKSLEYLTAAAKFNDEKALKRLVDYYNQDTLIDTNKSKILGYYDQLANIGSKDYTRKLAHQYLNGSRLVEPNRQKAREYYIKAGSWGDQYIKYMDDFDIGMKMQGESANAKYKVGRAYYYGYGVKEDKLEGVKYLKMASDEGHELALGLYTKILYMGIPNKDNQSWLLEPNWDQAIIYLKKHPNPRRTEDYIEIYNTIVVPAQNGDTTAYIKLGDWYKRYGSPLAARTWYQKSIDAGNLAAYKPLDLVTDSAQVKRQNYLDGTAKGDLFSKIQLAKDFLYDGNVPTDSADYNTAIQYLQEGMKSADSKLSGNAFNMLTVLYQEGIRNKDKSLNRPKDDKKYLALLQSEEANRPEALIQLYDYYAKTDEPKALEYLQRAYKNGDLNAVEKLYEINFPNQYCTNRRTADMDKASTYLKEWLEKSKFEKNTDRRYISAAESLSKKMGDVYLNGKCDMQKDIDKAIEWYLISLNYHDEHALNSLYKAYVAKGDAKQAYYIALRLKKNTSNIELFDELSAKDKQDVDQRFADEQAFQKYGRFTQEIEEQRVKAEAGDKMAAFSLGIAYARGEKVPKDTQKMIYYYELAGKNGYPRAYNILGNLYRKDNKRGIEKDFPKALYYFDLGAQQNDSNTAHLAGDMLYFGQGMPKDYVKAAKYYDMTDLEQGTHHAMAKYKLAYMYYNGWIGTKSKEDLQRAHDYLELGAKYLDKDSIKALQEWDFTLLNQ